jgi:hypothetical protein
MAEPARKRRTAIFAAAALALAGSSGALARDTSGSGDPGASLLRQELQNPRLIEPYGYADPSVYRLSHPQEGYYLRQDAQRHRYGRVRVDPYGYYRR